MNAIIDLFGPRIYNLLAWTAQSGVLAILGAAVARLIPHAKTRLLFIQSVLVLALLLPALEPWTQPAANASAGVSITTGPATVASSPPGSFHFNWRPEYLLWIVAIGAAVRLIAIASGLARLRAHRLAARRLDPPPVPFERDAVNWYISDAITSPVTFGWRHPSILLPARVAALPADLKEAIACHELIHVERRDWPVVLAEEFLRAILWFQPGVWILLAEIQLTREQVVDAEVIRLIRDRDRYLDALLAVATHKFQPDLVPAPLFLKRRHLAARVAHLLKETRMSKTRIAAAFAGASTAALLTAVVAVALFPLQSTAQTPSRIVALEDGAGISVDPGAPVQHRTPVSRPSGVTATGTVVVEATLDSNGEVSDARVVSGPEELRRSALQGVLQWHYAPGPSSAQVTINYRAAPEGQVEEQAVLRAEAEALRAGKAGEPATLKSIEITGAPDALAQRVRDALPVHEGDQVTAATMRQVNAAARQIDSHFRGSLEIRGNGEAIMHLMLVPPAAGVTLMVPPVSGPAAAPPSSTGPASGAPASGIVGTLAPGNAPAAPPQRIRVGGNVAANNLETKVDPAYPPLAKQARIQGVVHLTAIISKDGTVQNLQVISGHPLLVPAALDAVKQWVYKPTLLNGQPVEVVTQIDVNFTLEQ